MARIRTIKPDFWGSAKTARVSRDARLLFLGLLNEADDDGRMLASAKTLNGKVFPNDQDVADDDVGHWLKELEHADFVQLYDIDGVPYCVVKGFREHQRVTHPTASRLPAPPEEAITNDSRTIPESLGPEVEVEVEVEVDLGSGTGNREAPTAPDALAGFEEFWKAYPPRNGKRLGRAQTEARWKKLTLDDKRAAWRGAVNLADAVARDLTLPKDPERFLRGRHWSDWQEPAKARTSGQIEDLQALAFDENGNLR